MSMIVSIAAFVKSSDVYTISLSGPCPKVKCTTLDCEFRAYLLVFVRCGGGEGRCKGGSKKAVTELPYLTTFRKQSGSPWILRSCPFVLYKSNMLLSCSQSAVVEKISTFSSYTNHFNMRNMTMDSLILFSLCAVIISKRTPSTWYKLQTGAHYSNRASRNSVLYTDRMSITTYSFNRLEIISESKRFMTAISSWWAPS